MDKIWKEYEELRKSDNLTYSPEHRCYFASTREDADFFFRSENMVVDYPFRSTRQVFGKTMLDSDDEKFAITKKVIGAFFSVKAVRHYEEAFLNRIIARVLAEAFAAPEGSIDFETAIAQRIPVLAILEIFGIDASLEQFVFERLDLLIKYIDDSSHSLELANQARIDLYQLLDDCMNGTIALHPRGMLAQLDRSVFENRNDLLSTLTMVLTAGMATTVAGFNSLIVNLYSHAEKAQANRDNEKWIKEFVDETLREFPPLHSTVRFVKSPFVYKDTPLKKNQTVTIVMASANKDQCPVAHDSGEVKKQKGTYTFGKGKHACLGIQLAQSELVLFLKQFLPKLNDYSLDTHTDAPLSGHSIKSFAHPKLTRLKMEKLTIDHDYYFSKLQHLSTTLLWDRSYGKAAVIGSHLINYTPGLKLTGPCFLVETEGQILPVIHALHTIPENHILVINDLGEADAAQGRKALLGDIIMESVKVQKLKGVVVFGHVRDVDMISRIAVPLWAKGLSIKAARLGSDARPLPQELTIEGNRIRNGDWLIGDDNGLLLIEQEALRVVIKAAEFKNLKENKCIERIRSGEKISDQMNLENYLAGKGKLTIEF